LSCRFCQNWDISKSREFDRLADAASPERIADVARVNDLAQIPDEVSESSIAEPAPANEQPVATKPRRAKATANTEQPAATPAAEERADTKADIATMPRWVQPALFEGHAMGENKQAGSEARERIRLRRSGMGNKVFYSEVAETINEDVVPKADRIKRAKALRDAYKRNPFAFERTVPESMPGGRPLRRGVVQHVIDRHRRHVALLLKQEAGDRLRHPLQRGEGHKHRALRHVGPGQRLGVVILVEPGQAAPTELQVRVPRPVPAETGVEASDDLHDRLIEFGYGPDDRAGADGDQRLCSDLADAWGYWHLRWCSERVHKKSIYCPGSVDSGRDGERGRITVEQFHPDA
jgi:hypothetical protein